MTVNVFRENKTGRTTTIICTCTNAPKYSLKSHRLNYGSICDQNGRNFEPCISNSVYKDTCRDMHFDLISLECVISGTNIHGSERNSVFTCNCMVLTVFTPDASSVVQQNTIEPIIISDAVYTGCCATNK